MSSVTVNHMNSFVYVPSTTDKESLLNPSPVTASFSFVWIYFATNNQIFTSFERERKQF